MFTDKKKKNIFVFLFVFYALWVWRGLVIEVPYAELGFAGQTPGEALTLHAKRDVPFPL